MPTSLHEKSKELIKRLARGKLVDDPVEKEFENLIKQLTAIFNDHKDRLGTLESKGLWHSGKGKPNNGIGKDGDFYLDSATKDIFFKEAGKWL